MRDGGWRTLFHPFEAGHLTPPASGGRVLFLNADPDFVPPEGFEADIEPVQGFRPDFLRLERRGFTVRPEPSGQDYDMALVLAGRHRGRNEAWIGQALTRTRAGGIVVVAGQKADGIDSLRKRVAAAVELSDRLAKYHGSAFWFKANEDTKAEVGAFARKTTLVEGRFRTAPGMFSHGRVDPASRLLVECLPADIAGRVADFGAGWGYLADTVARGCPTVEVLDLYEADYESCRVVRDNLADLPDRIRLGVHWRDIVREPPSQSFDAIVMNPPFHELGRAADPTIGASMIKAASAALRAGGRLFLVANTALPYEAVIAGAFARQEEVRREAGFKVIVARK